MEAKSIEKLDNPLNIRPQDDIEDIIGNPPSWILYWGIIIIGFFLVLFYLMMAFIKYPDKLSAPVIITSENPAIKVYSEMNGKVESIFTRDQDTVVKNQNILLLESDVKWQDVILLKAFLSQLDTASTLEYHKIPTSFYLGELQDSYTQLIERLDEYQYLLNDQSASTTIHQINSQILHTKNLNSSITKQTKIFENELIIDKNKYTTSLDLFKNGAISNREVENVKQKLLSSQRQLENMQAQVINNNINIDQLNTRITELKQSYDSKVFALKSLIKSLISKTNNQIAEWERLHLFKAPIDGVLSLSKIWSANQSIKSGDVLFTVIPTDLSAPIIARAKMPADGIGKIALGTNANLRLKGYPEQEFGILKSKVHSISLFPDSDDNQEPHYLVELSLNNSLITTYNRTIPMQHEMSGSAELITEDKTILQRIMAISHFDALGKVCFQSKEEEV